MPTRNSKCNGSDVVAVGYVRRSTNKQEKSLDDQRSEIKRYAAKQGYRIVRWYEDDAISGDSSTEHRPGFRAMHAAACNGRDFDAIIVWDQDRLGRWAPHEASYWTFPLAQAGVRLDTVSKGLVDWDDFAAWLKYSVDQHGKHQYLRDLSANVSRGAISNASQGYSCGHKPYGYDRVLVDETGQEQQRLCEGDKYVKPRNWRVVWAVSNDPIKVSTVRWLFETYATTDIGYRALAKQLNERNVPSPSGGKWHDSTVRSLLANPVYIGTFVWNKRRHGKYSRVVNGDIVQRDRSEIHLMPCGKPNASKNPPELWTVIDNSHEPLIDRKLFDTVQAKMARRKRSSGCSYQTHTRRKDRQEYLLTGLLYCQHCGRKMHGSVMTRRKNGRVYRYQRYICSSNTRARSCGHYAIRQDQIIPAIIEKIREDLLLGSLDRLKASLRSKLKQRQKPDTAQLKRLRKRQTELDKQIDTGAERLLTAPENLLDVLTIKLQQMKQQRDQIAAELRKIEQAAKPVKNVRAEVERLAKRAWTLLDELQQADPSRVRELLNLAIEKIELQFTTKQHGKKRIHHPTGGKVVFRGLSGFASRGDRI